LNIVITPPTATLDRMAQASGELPALPRSPNAANDS
jgi:hypothetical protein